VPSPSTNTVLLFPGALGDFLCLWPALEALADGTTGRVRVFAKPAWLPLLDARRFDSFSIDRREIADLFATGCLKAETRALLGGAPSIHSWTGHGDARFAERLALAGGGAAVHVHRFRGMADGEHACEYFARCLGVPAAFRPLRPGPDAERWADDFWLRQALGEHVLAVHPGSGSAKKNWLGMPDVARLWRAEPGGKVLLLAGPAEDPAPPLPFDALARNERLDRVAALLRRARLYLGNDSGVSHLAGLAGARGVVLFSASDPRTWRPLGDGLEVLHAPEPCPACGADRFCTHRATVENVCSAMARAGAGENGQPTNV
jgi:hypothetical protein